MSDFLDYAVLAYRDAFVLISATAFLGYFSLLCRKKAVKYNTRYIGYDFAIFIDTKLTCLGVIHHELAHAIATIITGAKIADVKLFKIDRQDGSLGSVCYYKRGSKLMQKIQDGFISVAPVCLGTVSMYILWTQVLPRFSMLNWQYWLDFILILHIGYHANMSKTDYKNCGFYGWFSIWIVFFVVFLVLPIDIRTIISIYGMVCCMLLLNLIPGILLKFINLSRGM